MNPYFERGFFEFFWVLFSRCFECCCGHHIVLAEDEIQLLLLILLSISSVLVGCFLTLRKMTMFANSLSHTILVGIVLAYLIFLSFSLKEKALPFQMNQNLLFVGALLSAGVTYLFIEVFQKFFKLHKDSSIGFVFTFLFALGVLLVSIFAKNSHIGIEVVMGNLDALDISELKMQALLTAVNLILVGLFYRPFIMTSFDRDFSRNFPLVIPVVTLVLLFQTALTTIGAYKVIGALLFLTFLTAPVLSAKLFSKNLKELLLISSCFSITVSFVSIALSRHILTYYNIAISTSGLCSTLLSLSFPLSYFVKRIFVKKRLKRKKIAMVASLRSFLKS